MLRANEYAYVHRARKEKHSYNSSICHVTVCAMRTLMCLVILFVIIPRCMDGESKENKTEECESKTKRSIRTYASVCMSEYYFFSFDLLRGKVNVL